jgi:hypothetical protein
MTAGRIARELWWNQEFPLSVSFHNVSPCSYIAWGMNSTPVGGRSSETQSHPIDLIIVIKTLLLIRKLW